MKTKASFGFSRATARIIFQSADTKDAEKREWDRLERLRIKRENAKIAEEILKGSEKQSIQTNIQK
jgi:hypothetical protein